jgi:putative sterol carrier protein
MTYFEDVETFYGCIQELFDRLKDDPEIKKKALDSKLIVSFVYSNPDGEVWIDCTGDDIVLTPGEMDLTADATLSMETDIAHKFWLGKLNLIKALTSGDIKSEGSVPKLLKLLPVIKPAFSLYPEILKEKGLEELVEVE